MVASDLQDQRAFGGVHEQFMKHCVPTLPTPTTRNMPSTGWKRFRSARMSGPTEAP